MQTKQEKMAVEIAAQVAHSKVTVTGNRVNISLVRDPLDSNAFKAFQALIARVQDSLEANLGKHNGAKVSKWMWSRGGSAEMRTRGGTMELYTQSVEVL